MKEAQPDNQASPFKKLTVIGTGLIGGSFLMACRETNPGLHIRAVDRHDETLQYLLKHQLADKVSLDVPDTFDADELTVIAIHLKDSLSLLRQIAPAIQSASAVVTDIGSCKAPICALGDQILPTQFVGGHPLAGKEFSGVQHATSLLFAAKPYILCKPSTAETDPTAEAHYQRVYQFIETHLRPKMRVLDPNNHDRYMAFMSHFPQLYAILLSNLIDRNQPGHLLPFYGTGVDEHLRLAASPYEMWGDVFELNADNIQAVMDKFRALYDQSAEIFNQPAMTTWFDRSHQIYDTFHAFKRSQ